MGNVFETVGEDIVHGVEAAGKEVAKVFTVVEKTGKVIDVIIKDESEIKQTTKQVLQDGVTLAAKVATVVGEKGLSITDDAALVAEIEAYFTNDIQGKLVPVVEEVFGDIDSAVS